MPQKSSRRTGIICLVATILLFSTFEVVSKVLAPVMSPLQITFSRFLIGGALLLPFALVRFRRRSRAWTIRDWARVCLLGLVNIVISMGLVQLGLVYADASSSAALFSANPLFVVLFAAPLLGEKITRPKLIGLGLGLVGSFILVADKLGGRGTELWGLILVAAAAISFAVYTVLGKRFIAASGTDSLTMTTFSFLAGCLFLVPIMLFLQVPLIPHAQSVIPQLLFMAIGVTGLAYVLYFEGLSRLEAGAGAMLYFAKPALAAILAVVVLGEHITFNLVLGVVVIATGILVAQGRRVQPNARISGAD